MLRVSSVCFHTPIRQNADTVCVVRDLIRLLNTQIRSSSLYTDRSYHILEHLEVKLWATQRHKQHCYVRNPPVRIVRGDKCVVSDLVTHLLHSHSFWLGVSKGIQQSDWGICGLFLVNINYWEVPDIKKTHIGSDHETTWVSYIVDRSLTFPAHPVTRVLWTQHIAEWFYPIKYEITNYQ